MPTDDESFWNEMGVSWRASVQDAALMSRRLETRLKVQSALLTGAIALGTTVSVLGFGLAAWTVWIGLIGHAWNLLARGVTLAAVSSLVAMASLTLRARHGLETRSLLGMLQVLGARTERLIRASDLACGSVVILAVGGSIGYALRVRWGHTPAVPLIEDLLAMAVMGLALLWYRSSQSRALRRYRHLERAIGSGGENSDNTRNR